MRSILTVCLALLLALSAAASNRLGGPIRVMFDNTKSETAGNADWIIDDDAPLPQPTAPTKETDWTGALSSWGFALYQKGGYTVQTLPPSGQITFGDATNPQDLSRVDVFVLCEPNRPFSNREKYALLRFVASGGGLFLIADHSGADRDGDGWDAREVLNDFFQNSGWGTNPFGLLIDANSIEEVTTSFASDLSQPDTAALLNGPFGQVTGFSYHAGATLSVDPTANPSARALAWRNGSPQGNASAMLAITRLGNGRVALVGDSSPADDGTGTPGDDLYNGWGEAGVTDDRVFLNATAWLGASGGPVDGDFAPALYPLDTILVPPQSGTTPNASVEILDDGTLKDAELWIRLGGLMTVSAPMTHGSGSTWTGSLGGMSDGNLVEYSFQAEDSAGHRTSSAISGFFAGTTPISDFHAEDSNGVALYSGYPVRIRGVVTVASGVFHPTNNEVYVQDATCGVCLYQPKTQSPRLAMGDHVTVEGHIDQYRGKLEVVVDGTPYSIVQDGTAPLPQPVLLNASGLGEEYEGRLVTLRNLRLASGSTFPPSGSDGNVTVLDPAGRTALVRVTRASGLAGAANPTGLFSLTGIATQYDPDFPYTGVYQLQPRQASDLVPGEASNATPQPTIPTETIVEPLQEKAVPLTATDADAGETFTWTLLTQPAGVYLEGSTLHLLASPSQAGQVLDARMKVEDSLGASVETTFRVKVAARGDLDLSGTVDAMDLLLMDLYLKSGLAFPAHLATADLAAPAGTIDASDRASLANLLTQ